MADGAVVVFQTKCWLEGDPVHSVCYINADGRKIYTDMGGYRPDPEDLLIKGKTYLANGEVHTEGDMRVLRKLTIGGKTLAYCR